MTFPEAAAAPVRGEQDPRISRNGPGILNQMASMHEMTRGDWRDPDQKTREYIVSQQAKHDATMARLAAKADRDFALNREVEVVELAKDLLVSLAAADVTTPVEHLSGQAFAMADHFYAERDRRAAAIKSE